MLEQGPRGLRCRGTCVDKGAELSGREAVALGEANPQGMRA